MSNTKLWINLRHLIGCQWLCYDKKHLGICKSILIDSLSPHALYNNHETPTYICMNENWNVSWQWVDNECGLCLNSCSIKIDWMTLVIKLCRGGSINLEKKWVGFDRNYTRANPNFLARGGGGTMLQIRALPLDPPMIQMVCLSSQWWLIPNTLRMSYIPAHPAEFWFTNGSYSYRNNVKNIQKSASLSLHGEAWLQEPQTRRYFNYEGC